VYTGDVNALGRPARRCSRGQGLPIAVADVKKLEGLKEAKKEDQGFARASSNQSQKQTYNTFGRGCDWHSRIPGLGSTVER
jgi:hypothetical protein